jgi:hypothetical protein
MPKVDVRDLEIYDESDDCIQFEKIRKTNNQEKEHDDDKKPIKHKKNPDKII